jgi:hypothetical protein
MNGFFRSGWGIVIASALVAGCSSSPGDDDASDSSGTTDPTTTSGGGGQGGEGQGGDGQGGDGQGGDGQGGDQGAGGDGAGGSGGDLPAPVLCPEPNPFSPQNDNSVVISDVVLAEDTTWTADKVYLVGDDFKVKNHTLTVEAGTTICLYQTGRILVGEGIEPGEIHLDGTEENPIVITAPPSASDPTKPDVFHRGIQFDTYMGSTISHVHVWYGGRGGGSAAWAFELTNEAHGNDPTEPLLVDGLVVGEVQSKGVKIGPELGLAEGSSIRFGGFVEPEDDAPALDAVAEINIMASASFAAAFDASGATIPDAARHIDLRTPGADGRIDADVEVFDVDGIPYRYRNALQMVVAGLQDDEEGATLTIHDGVTLAMDGVLSIGGVSGTAMGNLVLAGTAERPVTITSTSDAPAAGDWEGIYFVGAQFDPARSRIEHAQILYGGVDGSNGQQINQHVGRCGENFVGAIMIGGSGGLPYEGPSISDTTIAHSASHGIVSDANDSGGYLSTDYDAPDITFEDIAGSPLDNNGPCN